MTVELESLRLRLMSAAGAGEIVRVVYHRGSQPGTVREIVPLSVREEEVVANDVAAGIEKTFKLGYLELADSDSSAQAYDPAAPLYVEESQTVQGALAPYLAGLRTLGWHVELSETRVYLHRFFKNGKPRRGYDVTMGFDEFTVDLFDDGDGLGLQTVTRLSKRPYNVSSMSMPTRTFVRLSSALPLFLEESRKLAPGPH